MGKEFLKLCEWKSKNEFILPKMQSLDIDVDIDIITRSNKFPCAKK